MLTEKKKINLFFFKKILYFFYFYFVRFFYFTKRFWPNKKNFLLKFFKGSFFLVRPKFLVKNIEKKLKKKRFFFSKLCKYFFKNFFSPLHLKATKAKSVKNFFNDFSSILETLQFSFLRFFFFTSLKNFQLFKIKNILFILLQIFYSRSLFRRSVFWTFWKHSQIFRYFFRYLNSFSFYKKIRFLFFLKGVAVKFSFFEKRDFFFLVYLWFFFLFHFKKLFLGFRIKLNYFFRNIFFFKKYISIFDFNFFNKIFYSHNSAFWAPVLLYSFGQDFFFNKIFITNISINIYLFFTIFCANPSPIWQYTFCQKFLDFWPWTRVFGVTVTIIITLMCDSRYRS